MVILVYVACFLKPNQIYGMVQIDIDLAINNDILSLELSTTKFHLPAKWYVYDALLWSTKAMRR